MHKWVTCNVGHMLFGSSRHLMVTILFRFYMWEETFTSVFTKEKKGEEKGEVEYYFSGSRNERVETGEP